MNSGIYAIINKINGNKYVGSAVDIPARWRLHRYRLRKNNHHSKHLQSAWNLYGEENFEFLVLETVSDKNELLRVEQKYLDELEPMYNTNKTAGNLLGFRHSEDSKIHMSVIHMGFRHTDESKKKMSEIWSGKPRGKYSEERCKKISESHLGKKLNENQARALDIGRRRSPTPEEIKRISDAQKGYQPTEETLEKLRQAWVKRKERALVNG